MCERYYINTELRILSRNINNYFINYGNRKKLDRMTGSGGWIISYIAENYNRDVFQRDIEKQFSVRRPTMTEILKLMEKNGLLVRERDKNDARLKKIKLTPLALSIHERHEKHIESFETFLREGISDDEMKSFFAVLEKLNSNIERAEKEHSYNPEEDENA